MIHSLPLSPAPATLVDLLRERAHHQPHDTAYRYLLADDQYEQVRYAELEQQARALAARLQALNAQGERVLLLYSPGLAYIVAFFGCLYAGAIAVPVYPPRRNRPSPRLAAIIRDAQAKFVLTDEPTLAEAARLSVHTPELAGLTWLTAAPTHEEAAAWQPPTLTGESLAFLQYTSGSTAAPKGVVLSHANLLHNSALIHGAFGTTVESRGVIWLPPYHDMGLIGGVLQPLYMGFPVLLMPPMAFLQQPYLWLQAISRERATISGGPNFAYDLCVEKITPAQRETLDLSSWRVAFNGAEPIRPDTLERFSATFAPHGFRREAFYPCYGLAEGTLIVSGGQHAAAPILDTISEEALTRHRVEQGSRAVVSSGQALGGQRLVIAHPDSRLPCAPDEVGEIWLSGPSAAQGYWGQPEATERTFRARLADTQEGPFLRTGDLGFLRNGELFVTGRLKDLIIVRGRNVYPQDIELTVEQSHTALRAGNGAAFAVEVDGEEQLVIAQEIKAQYRHSLPTEEIASAIRQAVSEQHELQVHAVLLLRTGSIPKTSSGKIQRHACRAGWQDGTLPLVGSSVRGAAPADAPAPVAEEDETPLGILRAEVARILHLAPAQVPASQPLHRLGLDSLAAVELTQAIESRWGVSIPMADLLEGVTLEQLAAECQAPTGQRPAPLAHLARPEAHDHAPLAFAQQRLWFLDRLAPGNPAYHVPVAAQIRGPLDIPALHRSLHEVIRRHESLRTTFQMMNGSPVQKLRPPYEIELPVLTLCAPDEAAWQEIVREQLAADAAQPFDLVHGPLLRAKLLRRDETDHTLLLTLHHIITDGWAMGVLAREVSALYTAFTQGQPSPLPPLAAPYADAVAWQRQRLEQEEVVGPLRTYWQRQLAHAPALLELPTDHPRPAVQSFRGAQVSFEIPAALRQPLQQLALEQDATLFMVLLAALKVLLHAHSHQDDLVVGTSVANRLHPEMQPLIGLFVNQLVLRTNLDGAASFREVLARVRQTTLAAYKHQEMPFDKLVELLQVERDARYNPLFQVNFVLENAPLPDLSFAGLNLTLLDADSGAVPFDLSLLVSEADGALKGLFRYNRDLFKRATVARWAEQYQHLLAALVADPAQPLAPLLALPAGADDGQQPQPVVRTTPPVSFPQDKTIHQLFEEQARRTPHAPAVVFEGEQLTFAELNVRANHLAHHLIGLGVGPEVRVALCLPRSLSMMVALLGILKAGGAYVPLDPTYPAARLAYLLSDARPQVVITHAALRDLLPPGDVPLLCLDEQWAEIAHSPATAPTVAMDPANLAYLLYTSGSTGLPKGVMVQHRSVVNLATALHEAIYREWGEGLRVSVNAPLVFDGSVKQWIQLLNGHTLCIVPEEARADATKLLRFLAQQRLDVLDCTPSLLKQLLAAGLLAHSTLTGVLVGGEALDAPTWAQVARSPRTRFVNVYGPTETTVDATACHISRAPHHPAIGQPIANVRIALLDERHQPVRDGARGELFLGGAGVARGYWNQPALTAARFLPDPLSEEPGARRYRTGDLARWRDDESGFEYIGRSDDQVQVQGVRIELGEIEAALSAHPLVHAAAAAVQESPSGERYLAAYLVPASGSPAESEWLIQLRAEFRQRLPLHLLPRVWVPLPALPLTRNGKVDRRALPVPDLAALITHSPFIAPRNELERTIATIWQEVLGVEKVGLHDNFWDLGGQSLLLVQAFDRLQARLDKKLSLVEMYRYPTVSALAQHLSAASTAPNSRASVVEERVRKQKEALQRQRRMTGQRNGQD